jgi:multiple sugar transport system substrate-binding protein
MTWDHARGIDPMVATSRAYAAAHPGIEIHWEKRPLSAFESAPLERLAREFDLMVIDHPHVGAAARGEYLLALDQVGRSAELAALESRSLGGSQASYAYGGRVWALAIDASAQVAAIRPDLLGVAPRTWAEVAALARGGKVLWPLAPIHALMSFFTLAANRGTPCATREDLLIDPADGAQVLDAMQVVASRLPPECLRMDPIEASERMAAGDDVALCPLLYAYVNYAREGFRRRRLKFADIPALGTQGPCGSTLGGTGLAVSAHARAPQAAVDYAFWVASGPCQKGIYVEAGGQPAHPQAWEDERANRLTHGFFGDVRRTLDRSWVRPRYRGYLTFQREGGNLVHAFLSGRAGADQTLRALDEAYRRSRAPAE